MNTGQRMGLSPDRCNTVIEFEQKAMDSFALCLHYT